MANSLHEIDLKTPTHSTFEPPPPYVYDAPQLPYPNAPPQSPPSSPYPSYNNNNNNIGFNLSSQQQQSEYPHYPLGTGAYPGAGSYCPPNPSPLNAPNYVVRTPPLVCSTNHHCNVNQMQRRRKIFFILSVFVILLTFSLALWIIFGV